MNLNSHLTFAHTIWHSLVQCGDTVIDATLGNGHDALALANMLSKGTLIGYDIQEKSINHCQKLLHDKKNIAIELRHQCHAQIEAKEAKLIVYNLGYLPGSDKSLTTRVETTLQSIKRAQKILIESGIISITLYPGHPEGAKELEALLAYSQSLDKKEWTVSWTSWPNRKKGPSVLLYQKKKRPLPS